MPDYSSYRRAFAEALVYLGERNPNLIVLDADTARSTGTILFAEKYPRRFINIGISEQDLIATAAGLAIAGKIPVAVAFAMFLLRGWEQIRNIIARDRLNVKLVGTHAGLSAHFDGSSHQCLEDIAVMRVLPNVTVVVPADAIATRHLIFDAIEKHKGPLYMRLGRDNSPKIYSEHDTLSIGKANILEDGEDLSIFVCGSLTELALDVSKNLKSMGISAEVVDVYTIKPLDTTTILKSVRRTGHAITIEEHNIIGGLGSAITEFLSETYPVRIIRIGIRDTFGASAKSYPELLSFFGLTVHHVLRYIKKIITGEVYAPQISK